jgi:SAM-dependent methyltransferase
MMRLARRLRAKVKSLPAILNVCLHPLRAQQRLESLAAENGQLRSVAQESGGRMPPPEHLQRRVVGVYGPEFLEGGKAVLSDIANILASHNMDLRQFSQILDFGCGCGRITRYVRERVGEHAKILASDIDAEAIQWCRKNLGDLAEFYVNPTDPPTIFDAARFDFIFSVSIFTHLPEQMQLLWIAELVRITQPGGYILLTIHGPNHFGKIPRRHWTAFERSGFIYVQGAGTAGLPSFYQTAFHKHEYVRREWSRYVDVVSVIPLAIGNHQDAVLCRKPLQ